ncbi:maestro heat-like repeat-containing protein family member 9 isoform X1 [Mesocricetus auratus]|uniref:Maestro heat-like repeat-containing protein family member 9 isoform X1 n=1 Tax=Mesocricetus auratus TaxID=10036 RepID=A0ABM2WVU4_MESAU|nr:maestro heat-like repeat-containing protein family member 9 isoform X1 [Mesocricetus auratus]
MSQDVSKTKTHGQTPKSTVKWYHVEFEADILVDTYAGLLSDQSIILAINSSFVDPLMQFEAQLKIIEISFQKLFSLPNLNRVKSMGKDPKDIEDIENLYKNIFNVYEDTLIILVSKDFYKIQILKEMTTWMNQNEQYLQERAMLIITRVLMFASKRAKKCPSIDAPCLGVMAAELSLLCAHEDPLITQQASSGMNYVLYIAMCQNSNAKKPKSIRLSDGETDNLHVTSSDFELLYKTTQGGRNKIAQSVGQILLPHLLTDFVFTLLKKLSSPDTDTAFEAASLLKLTLDYHAQKITMVSKIVDDIYEQLSMDSSHAMKAVLLNVISLLTRTSPKKVIFQLLEFPVPVDKALLLMWQAVSTESSVAFQVLKTILSVLKGKPGEVEGTLVERRRFSLDATNMMPVAASQALCTFLLVNSYRKVVAKLFPEFLMALMLQLFYCSQLLKDTGQDRPLYVRDGLKALLNCSGLKEVNEALEKKNFWNQFAQDMDHQYGIHFIAKTLSECNFPQFPETLHYVYKIAVKDSRRSEDTIVTIIFFTELLKNFFKESLPKEFFTPFRSWINDSNPSVSKMSLQKIASMAPVFSEIQNVSNLLLPILDAFLSKEHTVIIRAMLTLRNILSKLDKVIYSTVCDKIASSYCPLMDHVNGGVQCMAIRHFGDLLMDMSDYKWMLNHTILGGLVPLILFLESTELRIMKACRYTLTMCFSQLKWSTAYLLQEDNYDFESLVLSICNNLISSYESYIIDLISDTLGFLGSSRAFLKRGSIILVGYLGKSGEYLLLREEIDVMIEDSLSVEVQTGTILIHDLKPYMIVERVTREEDPVIAILAEKTHKLFKEIAYRIASSTVKQTLRRWVKVIRAKKLKPIYNLPNVIAIVEKKTVEDFVEMKDKESLLELTDEKSNVQVQKKESFFAT